MPALAVRCASFPVSNVLQARACTGGTIFFSFRERTKHAPVVKCTAVSSQEFKECACGKYTSLLVSRCCGHALVVKPIFVPQIVHQASTWKKHTKHPVVPSMRFTSGICEKTLHHLGDEIACAVYSFWQVSKMFANVQLWILV